MMVGVEEVENCSMDPVCVPSSVAMLKMKGEELDDPFSTRSCENGL